MSLDGFFSLFDDKKSTKEMIISILSEEFPLSAIKITRILSKRFKKEITCQGVYKELVNLVAKGIILKKGKEYMLNKKWILHMNKQTEQIYLRYTHQMKHSLSQIQTLKSEGDTLVLDFSSIFEIDQYFLDSYAVFNQVFPKDQPIFVHYDTNWWPLLYSVQELSFMNTLESSFLSLAHPKSEVDKWGVKFENDIGMHVREVKEKTPYWMFQLLGPLVFTYSYDPVISKEAEEFFAKYTKLSQVNLQELYSILNKKGNFRAVFMKNNQIRQQLLQEIKTHFGDEIYNSIKK